MHWTDDHQMHVLVWCKRLVWFCISFVLFVILSRGKLFVFIYKSVRDVFSCGRQSAKTCHARDKWNCARGYKWSIQWYPRRKVDQREICTIVFIFLMSVFLQIPRIVQIAAKFSSWFFRGVDCWGFNIEVQHQYWQTGKIKWLEVLYKNCVNNVSQCFLCLSTVSCCSKLLRDGMLPTSSPGDITNVAKCGV